MTYRYVPEVRRPPDLPAGWGDPTTWPPPGVAARRTAADGGRPLSAPELYVLYDAWTDGKPPSATTAIKLAIVELVRSRTLRYARRPRPRALGVPLPPQRWLVQGDTPLAAGSASALRDVYSALSEAFVATDLPDALGMQTSARGVRVSKASAPVRRLGPAGPGARRPDLAGWLETRVAQPLVDRGLATWDVEQRGARITRFLGPHRVLEPTAVGQAERSFARAAWELPPEMLAALRTRDPRRAAALVAVLGSAVLLQPRLLAELAELGHALEVLRPGPGDGSGGDGGSSTYAVSDGHDDGDGVLELGDLSGLDGLGDLGDLGDLSDAWDAVDGSVGSDGGDGGDGGGDGGGGD